MLLTAMESVTVTVHFADAFPIVAVITTVPPEMAVTSPAFTVLSRQVGIVRCCHKEKPGGGETAGKRRLILAFYCKLCYI